MAKSKEKKHIVKDLSQINMKDVTNNWWQSKKGQ